MNPVSWFTFDQLAQPWVLLLLVGVVALMFAEIGARAPGALSVSTGETLLRLRSYSGGLPRLLPPILRALGLACLIVALAGPLNGFEIRRDRANVIDIMLAVDLSGSMQQEDFFADGENRNRLYVTKAAVRDFIESRKERVEDRYGLDRVGLVFYAGYAWTACPLTLDYALLEHEMQEAEIDMTTQEKQGTAIGSALGLAVRRLSQSEAKSKVVILLTDGINNKGNLDPITAANIAKEYGMKVYTIGAGTTEEGLVRTGAFTVVRREPIDEDTLREIADITGGKYYRATDLASLQEAYSEINELETTEIDAGDFYEFKEAFMPYAVLGGLLLLSSIFMRRGWMEPIP